MITNAGELIAQSLKYAIRRPRTRARFRARSYTHNGHVHIVAMIGRNDTNYRALIDTTVPGGKSRGREGRLEIGSFLPSCLLTSSFVERHTRAALESKEKLHSPANISLFIFFFFFSLHRQAITLRASPSALLPADKACLPIVK